jgi:hypothetical protein
VKKGDWFLCKQKPYQHILPFQRNVRITTYWETLIVIGRKMAAISWEMALEMIDFILCVCVCVCVCVCGCGLLFAVYVCVVVTFATVFYRIGP